MRCWRRNTRTATAPPRCRYRSRRRRPGGRSQAWVKRVVGLPGDRIQMRQGQLFINDHPASLQADGVGEAEDDNGSAEAAHRYIETLPRGVRHDIFKLYDNGRLANTPEVIRVP